jgi:CRISPR/Cas system-associated exonuclease Cas4 (RecB family)
MADFLYLSYTGRKTYLTCPRKYWYRYVSRQAAVDDGRKALFGLAMGKIFEWFYNRKFWLEPDPVRKCLSVSDAAIDDACDSKNIDRVLHQNFLGDLRRDVRMFVPHAVETIRTHKLLTPCSRSEVDLTVDHVTDGLKLRLGGRADFVHGVNTVWVVDGKGSVHREKYVDSEQLIWYALLHYLKHHIAPSRLGFLHYRFPDDPMQWIVYDEQSMRSLFNKTLAIVDSILGGQFDPTPSGDCNRCEFKTSCTDGTKHLAAKRVASGGRIESSIFDLENVT